MLVELTQRLFGKPQQKSISLWTIHVACDFFDLLKHAGTSGIKVKIDDMRNGFREQRSCAYYCSEDAIRKGIDRRVVQFAFCKDLSKECVALVTLSSYPMDHFADLRKGVYEVVVSERRSQTRTNPRWLSSVK
jgi:hypothetical protein